MYTIIGLDAEISRCNGFEDIGIYTNKVKYLIRGSSVDGNKPGLQEALFQKLMDKLSNLVGEGPYLFVTWGGPEKECLDKRFVDSAHKVIDLEPIMDTLSYSSSLGKTVRKLGVGFKTRRSAPEKDAKLIHDAYDRMNRVTHELKWLIDPYRLSRTRYLETHRELVNSYIEDNLISDELITLLYKTVPKGLSLSELNTWYNRYRITMLTDKSRHILRNSHYAIARQQYAETEQVLSPELTLKDGEDVSMTDIEILKLKAEEDVTVSRLRVARNKRWTRFKKDKVNQVHREIQGVSKIV